MSAADISGLILTGVAVAGSIGSVLMLAFRVGKLTGTVEASISSGKDSDTAQMASILRLTERLDAHLTGHP